MTFCAIVNIDFAPKIEPFFVTQLYNINQTLIHNFSLFFSQVYYKDEIKGLVMYARQRGVLLLPEMDAPSHAAYGWQFGPEADLGKDLLRNGRNTSLNLIF